MSAAATRSVPHRSTSAASHSPMRSGGGSHVGCAAAGALTLPALGARASGREAYLARPAGAGGELA